MANSTATVAEIASLQTTVKPGFYDSISPIDILNVYGITLPTLDFVMPGLLVGTVGALVAAGATGKSWFVFQAGASIAAGIDIAGLAQIDKGFKLKPEGEKVVSLSGEEPREILEIRLHALRKMILKMVSGVEGQRALEQNFVILPLFGFMPDLNDKKQAAGLKALVANARLVIVDTLRRFHRESEVDDGAMASLIGVLESIAYQDGQPGPAILFLHHVNKASGRDGASQVDQSASRGSSVLVDNVRCQYNLATMTISDTKRLKERFGTLDEASIKRYVRLARPKANYCAPMDEVWYQRGEGGILEVVPPITAHWYPTSDHEYEQQKGVSCEPGHRAQSTGRRSNRQGYRVD